MQIKHKNSTKLLNIYTYRQTLSADYLREYKKDGKWMELLLKCKELGLRLRFVAQYHGKKLFVADLNHPRHVLVLLTEWVGDGLEKDARLDEVVERQTLFGLRVITSDDQLRKLWRQPVAELCKCCNTQTILIIILIIIIIIMLNYQYNYLAKAYTESASRVLQL